MKFQLYDYGWKLVAHYDDGWDELDLGQIPEPFRDFIRNAVEAALKRENAMTTVEACEVARALMFVAGCAEPRAQEAQELAFQLLKKVVDNEGVTP